MPSSLAKELIYNIETLKILLLFQLLLGVVDNELVQGQTNVLMINKC